jgi:hypothetical protein
MTENDLKIGGIYEHYKGNKYKLVTIATHTETEEKLVIYEPVDSKKGMTWVRPLGMFLETVEVGGKQIPRFKLISEA